MNMSCLEVIMDPGTTDSQVELHTATDQNEGEAEEWDIGRFGRKDKWEADKLMEAPETEHSGNTHTSQGR